jgi:cytoskeleton protein RodZ
MSDQSNPNVAEFFSPGPGERLRAARLSMGYDLAKIAGELHLTTSVVEALEADDFRNVGARVFVRGYLRNYARVVGMPVESVLRQFDEKWPDDGASHSMVRESPTLPADGGPSRGWAGAMTWLMILGLVALFLMWWRGYLDEIVPEQIRSSSVVDGLESSIGLQTDSTLPATGLDMDAPMDGGLRLPSRSLEEPPAAEVAIEGGVANVGVVTDSATEPAAVELDLPNTAAAGGDVDVPAVDATPGAAAAPAAAAATQSPGATEEGAPVVDATRQIVLSFSGNSWVDVRDSERKFKLFGEIPKGSRKVLGGQPPYKLVIGNAEAVSITVNGKPFDLAPYAKGNVARFTLDP